MPERRLHQMNWGAAISPTDALQVMDVGAFLARASLPIRPDNAVAAAGAPDNANLSVADITVILVYEEVTGPRFSLALDFSSAWICCGELQIPRFARDDNSLNVLISHRFATG